MTIKQLLLIVLCTVFLSCEKWDYDRAAFSRVITVGAIAVGTNDAFLIGDLDNLRDNAVVERGFVISNQVQDENSLQIGEPNTFTQQAAQRDTVTSDQAFASRVIDLSKLTTYYFRAYARLDDLTNPLYGQIDSFQTSDFTVRIAQTQCLGQGLVRFTSEALNANPGPEAPEVGLVWSNTNEFPTLDQDNKLIADIVDGRFSVEITPQENQLYYVRAYLIPVGGNPIYSEEPFLFSTTPGGEWIRREDFPGEGRIGQLFFSTEKKGYYGFGQVDLDEGCKGSLNDFWEYDPQSGWRQIPYQGATVANRSFAAGFAVAGKVYVGLGCNCDNVFSDFYEFDPETDAWSALPNPPLGFRNRTASFAFDNKGYIGGGTLYTQNCRDNCVPNNCNRSAPPEQYFQFDPVSANWSVQDIWGPDQFGPIFINPKVFSVGTKTYFCFSEGDLNTGIENIFWEYDAQTGWEKLPPFSGVSRRLAATFVIRDKAYFGLGSNFASLLTDFYEFDPQSEGDPWRKVAGFPGVGRNLAMSFSISGRGFVGPGQAQNSLEKDLWEYVPEVCLQ